MAKRQKKGMADTTQIGWRLVGGVYIEYIIKRIGTPWLVSDNGNVTNGKCREHRVKNEKGNGMDNRSFEKVEAYASQLKRKSYRS